MEAPRVGGSSGSATKVPFQLRNVPIKLMRDAGLGIGYQHAHEFEGSIVAVACLPHSLPGRRYFQLIDKGMEERIRRRLTAIRNERSG